MAPAPTAAPARPAKAAHRYRPGQAPAGYGAAEDSEDDESDEEQEQQEAQPKKGPVAPIHQARTDGLQVVNQGPGTTARQLKVQVTQDADQAAAAQKARQDAASSSEEEESEEEAPRSLPKPTYRAPGAGIQAAPVKEESSEYESSSEEESEEEKPAVPLYKPVFVSKRARDTLAKKGAQPGLDEDEEAELKAQAELEERRKQSTYLANEAIKRGLADRESGDKMPDVDDTDGLDPEGEFEAWKLRELMRLKRDKEALYAKEKEREELEARRAIPEALRLKEDTEHAKKLREEAKAKRGQQAFMQKYHHKGAFYADENADILNKHDYSGATESTLTSMESLPKVMQVRNYGKASRSKYTHLGDQDTSDRKAGWSTAGGPSDRMGRQGGSNLGQGCFNCGGDHMKANCPQLQQAGPSGANAGPVRRRPRSRERSRSPERGSYGGRRDDDRRRDDRSYRDRGRGDDYSRDRRRSRSRSRDRYGDDKRRRRD